MKTTYTLLLLLITGIAFAQSTTLTPGTVLPSMTTAKRTALASPTNGMLVFDTGTQSYWYRQSGTWVELSKSGSTSNYWQLTGLGGNEIKNTNSGGFWSANPTGLTLASNNTSNPPTAPVEGAGTRLMWIPSRSAFRAGSVTSNNPTYWSAANIGLFSFAAGLDNIATGSAAVAMGYYSQARGDLSTALGGGYASGYKSIALGPNAVAAGYASIAIGNGAQAGGTTATAIGYFTSASGDYSTTLGYLLTANGHKSSALGSNMNTNSHQGSFMIGDSDPMGKGVTNGGNPDEFVARFYNGYYLMTCEDNIPQRTGVYIRHGQSAWSSISDSTRKEKIVLADGESFLLKLRNLRLGSWNYKKQGATPERFYGPMAQEIFAAFGKDKYGTIGNDTTVSTLNMDGLLFIFSQALEKRTQELQQENEQLKSRLTVETEALKAIIQKLDARLESLESASIHNHDYKKVTDK